MSRLVGDYLDNPVGFVHDMFSWSEGEGPAPYQDEILDSLRQFKREAARGPRGLGKTSVGAWAVHWFALTREWAGRDWKIPTTAGSWAQLVLFLWPEIHKWSKRLRWDKIGREPYRGGVELLDLHLKLDHGQAFAVASKNTDLIEGSHAEEILYLFDEAQAIPVSTWDGAEGSLTSEFAYALAVSRPGKPEGRFYEIHSRRKGFEDWHTTHVTRDMAIKAGRMPEKWAEQREKQWGENSAIYQNHVAGEFAAQDEESVIPLAWVEAAVDRWYEFEAQQKPLGPLTAISLDVADGGVDRSIMAKRHGVVVPELEDVTRPVAGETMALAGEVRAVCRNKRNVRAIIDSIGVGAGVVSRCREEGDDGDPPVPVIAFNASLATKRMAKGGTFGFTNTRSAAWWGFREWLDPENNEGVCLPPDDELIGDLTAPKYTKTSTGKIQVESKDDIKDRLKRSTDRGDAVVMVFWAGFDEEPIKEQPEYKPTVHAEYARSLNPEAGREEFRTRPSSASTTTIWRSVHDE